MSTADDKMNYIKENLSKMNLEKHCKQAGCELNRSGQCVVHEKGGCPQSRHAKEYALLKTNPFYARLVNKQMAEAAMREVVQDELV